MGLLRDELERLLEKYPDPSLGAAGRMAFEIKNTDKSRLIAVGLVTDNKDPLCLGRLRMTLENIAPGAVSPWYQVRNPYASKKEGFWRLPDIGTQVIAMFPGGSMSQGVILGAIYDMKHRPPKPSSDSPTGAMLFQTKKHRIEIIDEEGKEGIHIESAQGKMRCVLSKEKGMEIINEIGKINIKCRKLTIVAEKNLQLEGSTITVSCDGKIRVTGKKCVKIESGGDVTMNGKNVKLKGSKGVTSGGKQLAVQGDKVMGFDVHQMEVPAGTSTAVVPLPHPFIGKINDKISDNVKIGGKGCATKGSKAKHDDSTHMQLPGTIKFVNNPNKEGEVTGGTAPKLKINGKEAACIGSMVTTCNDMGLQNNSTVIAPGASIPMPAIINPKNTEEWERERAEAEDFNPEISSVSWGKTSFKEGEAVELKAAVKDIADGNQITLQVFREGGSPEKSSVALAKFSVAVKGGVAKCDWKYSTRGTEEPPASDPKFVFSAHSAWCPFKVSEAATVELVRPKLESPEWKDKDGGSVSSSLVGNELTMSVKCTDMEDGTGVTFTVLDSANRPVAEERAAVSGGKAEAKWTYRYTHDSDHPLKEKPSFKFKVQASRAAAVRSAEAEISGKIEVLLKNEIEYDTYGFDVLLIQNGDTDTAQKISFSGGKLEKADLIPGEYMLCFEMNEKKEADESYSGEVPAEKNECAEPYDKLIKTGMKLSIEKVNVVVIKKAGNGLSE